MSIMGLGGVRSYSSSLDLSLLQATRGVASMALLSKRRRREKAADLQNLHLPSGALAALLCKILHSE